MHFWRKQSIVMPCLAAFATAMVVGCIVHAGYYDPYYHDRHPWAGEAVYYQQWEHDNHHEHRDFKRRSQQERREYWEWRHHQH
jgi:hypothetical protein